MPENSPAVRRLLRLLPETPRSPWQGVAVGAGCTLVAALLRQAIDPYVEGLPYITFFPFVALASVFGGTWGGVSSLLLSVAIGVYAWVPPEWSIEITAPGLIGAVTYLIGGAVIVGTMHLLNDVVQALRRSEARASMIAGEMQHRVKNVLQVVQSMSTMTARNAVTPQDHQTRLNARIKALAQALEAPRAASHLPVDLKVLLSRLLQPFDLAHFSLAGPALAVTDDTGSMLGLAVHELATNASKYGALSAPGGAVDIRWHRHGGGMARLEWQERGGPPVAPPTRTGFGSKLIRTAFKGERGSASLAFDPDGVRCVLTFPAARELTPSAVGRDPVAKPSSAVGGAS